MFRVGFSGIFFSGGQLELEEELEEVHGKLGFRI